MISVTVAVAVAVAAAAAAVAAVVAAAAQRPVCLARLLTTCTLPVHHLLQQATKRPFPYPVLLLPLQVKRGVLYIWHEAEGKRLPIL
jgi:hypothetical protein